MKIFADEFKWWVRAQLRRGLFWKKPTHVEVVVVVKGVEQFCREVNDMVKNIGMIPTERSHMAAKPRRNGEDNA